jgi:hypothetical protein
MPHQEVANAWKAHCAEPKPLPGWQSSSDMSLGRYAQIAESRVLTFSVHYGLGYGTGAHAPDEIYPIDSTDPKLQGLDGAVASFVEYPYALA